MVVRDGHWADAAFEPRNGQRRMAAAVADMLEDGGVLLVEAGTGTGKTLAYLVPAIRAASAWSCRPAPRTCRSRSSPRIRPAHPRAAGAAHGHVHEGRGELLLPAALGGEASRGTIGAARPTPIAQSALIDAWAEVTKTGDRAEIDELPEDLPFWPQIAATSETCAGSTCPRFADCFVTRMRQRAAESDVVT